MVETELAVTKRTPRARRGLVAAEHPLGARVGADVLARGGNAVDAAVATAFAMTVVEPFMSTIAGAGTLLVHVARTGETSCVDFNAAAPGRATDSMFPLAGGMADALFAWPRVVGDANLFGPLSVAVPGSVAGLALALARFGTFTLADALAPAVRLACQGFETDWYLALNTVRYHAEISAWPETARTFLRDGRWVPRPPTMEPGDRVTYPELGDSLALIARDGPDAFYRGPLGAAIADHVRSLGGVLTRADLAAYGARVVPPLTGRYRGVELAFSPGATGGVTALEMLNVLGEFTPRQAAAMTSEGLRLRARVSRRAFEDRLALLGDPAHVKAPWERLASAAYARELARGLRGRRADGPRGRRADGLVRRARGRPRATAPAADSTTHVSVIDRAGNMVALTHTAVSLFGSRLVVPGTGILLNNGMIWFDPEPGKPNAPGPGKRVLCNMTPVLGFRRGRPWLALGAPGGRRIVSAIPQVLVQLIDGRRRLQAAIDAPRLHAEGPEVLVDDRVGVRALAGLAALGESVVPKTQSYSSFDFAKPVGVRVGPDGLEAGLDAYGAAAAAGP